MAAAQPKLAAPHFTSARSATRRGDLAGAAARKDALKIDPRCRTRLNNLASIELTNNKAPTKAESLASRAVAAAPTTTRPTPRHGWPRPSPPQGKHEAALAEQQQAVRLEPSNP